MVRGVIKYSRVFARQTSSISRLGTTGHATSYFQGRHGFHRTTCRRIIKFGAGGGRRIEQVYLKAVPPRFFGKQNSNTQSTKSLSNRTQSKTLKEYSTKVLISWRNGRYCYAKSPHLCRKCPSLAEEPYRQWPTDGLLELFRSELQTS